MRRLAAALALVAACVRPRPIDVGALIAARGLDGAVAELRFRVASDAHDRAAFAALGDVEARRDRPGAALAALDRADALGGAPGDPLPARDRLRLGELYLARGRERTARGAPAAVADLDRARALGAFVPPDVARAAEIAGALAELRHADARVRAHGLARLAGTGGGDPRFAAAEPLPARPTAEQLTRRGVSGAWLWDEGARRAALDVLDAWAAGGGLDALAIAPPPDGAPAAIAERWLAARAWWNDDAPAPLVDKARALGASTCAIAAAPGPGCDPADAALDRSFAGPPWEPILWRRAEARGWRTGDPAWLVIAARAWLRGDAPSFDAAARAHLAAPHDVPAWARPTLLRLAGRPSDEVAAAFDEALVDPSVHGDPRGPRLVVAVEAAIEARAPADVASALGKDRGPAGDALLARLIDAPAPPQPALAHAAAARALRGSPEAAAEAGALAAIAAAYLRDPALADRTADDWIARDVDVAARAPIAAALFAALGDPARARALWQRAADASPGEVRVARGLARAAAAADDPDAAMILVTAPAAASGDAAPVLLEVARALASRGRYDHALELLHLAVQLVPPGDRAPFWDLAIAWSTAEGKDTAQLAAARARYPAAPPTVPPPDDPDALARAARLDPRAAAPRVGLVLALPAGDPRRDRALAELAAIAADPNASDADADAAWTAYTRPR